MNNNRKAAARSSGAVNLRSLNAEDTQPNELIQKRSSDAPPVLTTASDRLVNGRGKYRIIGMPVRQRGQGPPGSTRQSQPSTHPNNSSSLWKYNSPLRTQIQPSSSKAISVQERRRSDHHHCQSPPPEFSKVNESEHPIMGRVSGVATTTYQSSDAALTSSRAQATEPSIIPYSNGSESNTGVPSDQQSSVQILREALSPNFKTSFMSTKEPSRIKNVYKPRPVTIGIKREPSPSPIDLRPRKITEGSKLYTPLPEELRRTHHDYIENRRKWLDVHKREMKQAGLIPRRAFFRDDGISIDWTSKVPVRSDTLSPAFGVLEDENDETVSEHLVSAGSSSTTNAVVNGQESVTAQPQSLPIGLPQSIPSPDSIETVWDIEVAPEDTEEFLRKYIQTFDRDRALLASAYSKMGTLSCQIHRPTSVSSFPPSSSASITSLFSMIECGLKQGRMDVLSSLVSINPSFKFTSTSRGADFAFDSVGLEALRGVFVTCYAQLVSGRDRVGVHMAFVLRDKDEDEEDRKMEGLWSPLVIVSHQITFIDLDMFCVY